MYKTFATLITKSKKNCIIINKYDIIIPVPVYIKKKKQKGYNQTELIAKEIARICNINCRTNILKKVKDTKKQSTLTKKQRYLNVKNAFEINCKEEIKNKNVILFDDIYTTGNTVKECSKCLKKAKVNEILILTLAKD